MIRSSILGTAHALVGRQVHTDELLARAFPDRAPGPLRQRIGIDTRYWVHDHQTTAEIGAGVLGDALADARLDARELDRIILVISSGGDCLVPASANGVAHQLGLDNTCDCFDLNNACTGFLSGLDIASRCVATGSGPVAVVAVETLSRHIDPSHPRAWVVLGDAAGACILGPGDGSEGVLASHFSNRGAWQDAVYGPHPILPRLPDKTPTDRFIDFHRGYQEIRELALSQLWETVDALMAQSGLAVGDIDWLAPHQPNGGLLDFILSELGVAPERTVRVVQEIGSVGAASVAVTLDRVRRQRPLAPGDTLMLLAMGGGISHGGLLWRLGGAS